MRESCVSRHLARDLRSGVARVELLSERAARTWLARGHLFQMRALPVLPPSAGHARR